MTNFESSIAATCFECEVGGIGPNHSFQDQMLTLDEVETRYGIHARNAYSDMIAARRALRRVQSAIRES